MSVYYLAHNKIIPLSLNDLMELVKIFTHSKTPLLDLNILEDTWFSEYYDQDPDYTLNEQAALLEKQRNEERTEAEETDEEMV